MKIKQLPKNMRINKRLISDNDAQDNTNKQIVLEAYYGKQDSPQALLKTKQNYFTNSKRSNCLLLPQISQGPQKYNIQVDQQPRTIPFNGYSPRINTSKIGNQNEFQIPGVGKYTINKEILYQKKVQIKPNSLSPKPFREYSYINTELKGPSFLEYPKSEEKGLKFNTTERFPNKFDYHNDYYYLFRKKKIISTNTSPAFSIPKASTDVLNYSQKKKNQLLSGLPGPGEYYILSKSTSAKEICFSKANRFKQHQQLSPGPGKYNPYLQKDQNISFGKAKRFN